MRLTTIAAALGEVEVVTGGSASPEAIDITDITHDSREVVGGSLFCCVRGAQDDGHRHAADAVRSGAVALLVDHRLDLDVTQLVVPDVRAAMAPAAAACFGDPSTDLTVVGVTGTNGKTTTTWMLRNILDAAGLRVEILGTLSGARTTPEATDLQRRLAQWRDDGVEVVAMEVSSHAIDQHRIDAMEFRVAMFTNLSPDHLDYHGSMEAYFETKARLFEPSRCAFAVVNLDSPHGRLLADGAMVPTDGYSIEEAQDLRLGVDGSDFLWSGHGVTLPIGGEFNVSNAIGAAHVARALGVDDATIAAGLSAPLVVEGRFERVHAGQPFAIVVDYAHTPDGLERLLVAAGDVVDGRVIVVFGCGGDRDRSKRPLMGRAAVTHADMVVVTADNSRSESTDRIITSIMEGVERVSEPRATTVIVEPDRRAAIALALGAAAEDDIVLLAGKGHETVQILGGVSAPFDDRVVAAEEWRTLEAAR